jgi:hypothetical protein
VKPVKIGSFSKEGVPKGAYACPSLLGDVWGVSLHEGERVIGFIPEDRLDGVIAMLRNSDDPAEQEQADVIQSARGGIARAQQGQVKFGGVAFG